MIYFWHRSGHFRQILAQFSHGFVLGHVRIRNESFSVKWRHDDTILAFFDNFWLFSWFVLGVHVRIRNDFFSVKWRQAHSGTADIFEGVKSHSVAQWVPARHSGLKEVETYPVFWFNRVCLHLCIGENRKKVRLIILQCTTCIKGNNDNLPCSIQTF